MLQEKASALTDEHVSRVQTGGETDLLPDQPRLGLSTAPTGPSSTEPDQVQVEGIGDSVFWMDCQIIGFSLGRFINYSALCLHAAVLHFFFLVVDGLNCYDFNCDSSFRTLKTLRWSCMRGSCGRSSMRPAQR